MAPPRTPSAAERADGTRVYAETLRSLTAFDHDLAVEAAEDLGRAYRKRYREAPAREELRRGEEER